MQPIALFLEQFKSIGLESLLLKDVVIEGVHKYIGIKLERKQVEIKNNNVYVTLPPSGKSEMFMKREVISLYVVNNLGRKIAPKLL